ncbi:MAG: N-acetylmuramoyl-L-alanine amidase, partial [Ruminococcaceae bacterium]|nr:N-acetylmuramoyl-L-alanine amidase [Oscillospiraceae bacterium]
MWSPSTQATAAQAGAELFISIHGNSDGVGKNSGFEVYAAPPGRTYHDGSLAFAKLIVSKWHGLSATVR